MRWLAAALALALPAPALLAAAPAQAPQEAAADAEGAGDSEDDFGDFEDAEDIEEVADAGELGMSDLEEGDPASPAATLVGYFHPALVHMPAAWLLLLVVVDALGLVRGSEAFRKVGGPLVALVWASFPPAIVSGLMRLEHLGLEGDAATPALVHRNLALLAFGLVTLAAVGRWRSPQLSGGLRWLYLALVGAAALVVAVAGHLGGAMVFGDLPL